MRGKSGRSRLWPFLNLAAYLVAILAIGVSILVITHASPLRWRFDATKTRAYSLSPQTERLLAELDGPWTIAIVMVASEADPAVQDQVGEILDRFRSAAPDIDVVRIDPTDPATLVRYESLLGRLRAMYATETGAYDEALDRGETAFSELRLFAQQQVSQVTALVEAVTPTEQDRAAHWPGRLTQWSDEGGGLLDAVRAARRIDDVRPIADYDGARSILAAGLGQGAQELDDIARVLDEWADDASLSAKVRQFAATASDEYDTVASMLAAAADPLRRLPPLKLSSIGNQLTTGEAAIVMGEGKAAVIPSGQLFPTMSVETAQDGVVSFDRRFRGEQIIAATIQSLRVEHMPKVVFTHVESGSILRRRERGADVSGLASMLLNSRYEVTEWNVATGERPSAAEGQSIVWIVIPPVQSGRFGPEGAELRLVQEIRDLIAGGAAVLINVNPSLAPVYGRDDPWATVTGALGIAPAASEVVYESVVTSSERATLRNQIIQAFESDHPISRAVHGQSTFVPLAMPLSLTRETLAGERRVNIVEVTPSPSRWLEDQWWNPNTDAIEPPLAEDRFEDVLSIGIAVERPLGADRQRAIVIGSGGWMLSFAADEVVSIGGDRVALTNPGNYELGLASVAWLSGLDDLIAPSPVSQQTVRLDGVTPRVQATWFSIVGILMPLACLGLGLAVWFWRRW